MSDRVVVIGSINVDHAVEVERFPRAGETLLASSLSTSMGGKGANQAVAAAKSGATVAMIGTVGDDPEGMLALESLDAAGVETSEVRRSRDAPTGSAWITVAAGDNTILVVPGANHVWSPQVPSLRASDVVLCQLEIPIGAVEGVAATSQGTFILNAAPATRLGDGLLGRCDVLVVNEHELAVVSQRSDVDPGDTDSVIAASTAILDRGAKAVVTTLGSRGAILCTADGSSFAATPPTPEVVDSTGAGDAFCGVFAGRLAVGASLNDALRAGVTAGSLAVQHPTAQGGYDEFAHLAGHLHNTPEITTRSKP